MANKRAKKLISQTTKIQYINAQLPKESIVNKEIVEKTDKIIEANSKIKKEIEEKKVDINPKKAKKTIGGSFLYIMSLLLLLSCIICLVLFEYRVYTLDVLPTKYFVILTGFLSVLLLLTGYVVIRKKGVLLRIFMLSFMLALSFASILVSPYLQNTQKFLQGTQVKKDFLSYKVLVLKDSNFKSLENLKGENIGYLNDDYRDIIKSRLKINYNEIIKEDFSEMLEKFITGEISALVLENGRLNLANELIEKFDEKTRTIYEFEVEVPDEIKPAEENIKVSETPFVLYISGIDQYGKVKSVRGRSDVNQIMIVNPNTSKVLIVNTPRDYYVQLHGTTGLKDKLTHAGVYGIEKSITTLEDLYNIDIDYYLRVNFNTLIEVVDVIGGIDINSDKAFTAYTDNSVKVQKGINHFNGKQALAYSRERYSYVSGDRHRGENQQQVISAIIEKLTSSEVLLNKYNDILKTLDGTFQTNMPVDKITSMIKFQLDKMPKWKIESIAVDGFNSSNYTYSMGSNRKLYVMEPNMETVNNAISHIKEVLNEN